MLSSAPWTLWHIVRNAYIFTPGKEKEYNVFASAWPVMFHGVSPASRVWDSISGDRLLPFRLGWRGGSASATEEESRSGRRGELLTVLVLVLFRVPRCLQTVVKSVSVINVTMESSENYIYFSQLALANVALASTVVRTVNKTEV